MQRKEGIAESLLPGAGAPRPQPVGIRKGGRLDNLDPRRVGDRYGRQHVRHRIEGSEALVRGDLQYGGRGIERAVDRPDASAVPTPAELVGTLAAVPVRSVCRLVEPP